LKPKKTLSNWLTTRYQLIIRNEENFAEKTSAGFTYSKIILFSVIFFAVMFVVSLFLVKTILAKWFDPKHEQMVLNQKLYELKLKVDSLAVEDERKDKFITNFQRVLSGDTSNVEKTALGDKETEQVSPKPGNLKITSADSAFRRDFERSDLSLITQTNVKYRELQETFYFGSLRCKKRSFRYRRCCENK
jgi:hypothetical protein